MPGLFLSDRYARPAPPVSIADAAQMWAREKGRRFGRMEWNPGFGCFMLCFGRRSDDPVLKAWQEGEQLEEEPFEIVMLQEWDGKARRYAPMDLEAMGPSGLRDLLDRADLISGQGEYDSIVDAVKAVQTHNAGVREGMRQKVLETGQEMDWLHRRSLAGIPYITAGIDLNEKATP